MIESFLLDLGYLNIQSAIDRVDTLEKIDESE
jgi:hypothetical protein